MLGSSSWAPETARVLDSLGGWADGLRSAGVTVDASARPDLVVTGAAGAGAAAASGAPMALVEGRGVARALAAAYPRVERFLPIPTLSEPQLILPLSHRAAADYAVRNWSLGLSLRRRARNRAARFLLARGALPGAPGRSSRSGVDSTRPLSSFEPQARWGCRRRANGS